MTNFVIAYSQQSKNSCKQGDTEQGHMYTIAKILYGILSQDKRLNVYMIPKQSEATDLDNLRASIRLSNAFIKKNGGKGFHLELHSDAGNINSHGASGLYKSEAGKAFITPIWQEMADLTPTKDMGIRKRTDLGALNNTIAVAGLLEIGFHDKQEDSRWIHDNAVAIAVRISNGVYKFFMSEGLI